MTTLAEHMIVVGAENRPPMLDKSMYNSWKSQNGQIRKKKYVELTEQEKLQDDCDVQETNIVLQGLSPDVYSLVNHCQAALQPEWSKFMTNVKLAKNMYNTNYDQLYAYLSQHEGHANEASDDPISCLNKEMAFMSIVMASRFPSTNNQLTTSSNPRNQATIQDGRVTVQQVQGRQGQSFSGTRTKGNATISRGNNAASQARVVKCYNCQGEGHMARQCTQPKRPRNSAWFKEKMLLVQAQESGQVLDKDQLAFLAYLRIADGQATQTTILQNDAFQTDDLDAYDSDCDDISSAKAVLMANLSSYDSNVLFEVPQRDTYQNDDMINQSVQEMQYFEQSLIDYVPGNKITSDSNIISYEQYLQETQNAIVQDTNSSAQQDAMIMKHDVISVVDEEETLILEEESRSKMRAKQNDPILKEKKINISLINSSELNKLSEDFGKRFVPQMKLSTEQAFWLSFSNPKSEKLVVTQTPVEIEVPKELPKVSLVNTSFQKLKNHLAKCDKVVKVRTTPDAITEGSWGFKHSKKVFLEEVIPFINSLRASFKDFDNGLHSELNEVKTVFNQIKAAVEQCSIDKKYFDIQKKELFLDND
ncbi:retrovirus-related pol polyprotein from transposon TNT 1-94 [Tanacetum coccineum]